MSFSTGKGASWGMRASSATSPPARKPNEIIRQTNRELAAINAINKASSDSAWKRCSKPPWRRFRRCLSVDSARIYLLDESGELIYLVVSKGLTEAFVEKTHIQVRNVGHGLDREGGGHRQGN